MRHWKVQVLIQLYYTKDNLAKILATNPALIPYFEK